MNDKFVAVTSGIAGALGQLVEAVKGGKITPEAQGAIIQSARNQSGELDPKAVEQVELLAKQMQHLATALRRTQKTEAIPAVTVTSYPIEREKLAATIVSAVLDIINTVTPLSMSCALTIRGGVVRDDGRYDVLVAHHHFLESPTKASTHYVVTVTEDGIGSARQVKASD